MPTLITSIEKEGRDLVINDAISIPKDSVIIAKRDGFCTLTLPKRYYIKEVDALVGFLRVSFETCEKPQADDNDELFNKLTRLKKPT